MSSSPLRTREGVNPNFQDYALKVHRVDQLSPRGTFFNLEPVINSRRKRGRSGLTKDLSGGLASSRQNQQSARQSARNNRVMVQYQQATASSVAKAKRQQKHSTHNNTQKCESRRQTQQVADDVEELEFSEIFSWGNDRSGQLGLGPKHAKGVQKHAVPRYCSFNIAIRKVACGLDHSVFITNSYLVYSMGSNSLGQLGIIDKSGSCNKFSPILIEDLMDQDPYDVECGSNHTLVLTRYGTVFAWGNNHHGQCGVLKSNMKSLDVTVAKPTLVNCNNTTYNINQISCGADHSAVLDSHGKLQTFGSNQYGQLGLGSFSDEFAPVLITSIPERITQVACGVDQTIVLVDSGRLFAMGNNANGQLGFYSQVQQAIPTPSNIEELNFQKIAKIRAGQFSAALSIDGQLFVWGKSVFGEFFQPHRVKSAGLLDIQDFDISKGGMAAILTKSGFLYTWGDNKNGQLGHGDTNPRGTPEIIDSLKSKKITQIALGHKFTIVLGMTLPMKLFSNNNGKSPRPSSAPGNSRCRRRLQSANPVARCGTNKGFSGLPPIANQRRQQHQSASGHSPLRNRSSEFQRPMRSLTQEKETYPQFDMLIQDQSRLQPTSLNRRSPSSCRNVSPTKSSQPLRSAQSNTSHQRAIVPARMDEVDQLRQQVADQKAVIFELETQLRKVTGDYEAAISNKHQLEQRDFSKTQKEIENHNLLKKVTELQIQLEELRERQRQERAGKDKALEEAVSFRNDVVYLTTETDRLLKDIETEVKNRQYAEDLLRQTTQELEDFKASIPPYHHVEVAEIGALRDLNHISERDIVMLQQQADKVLKENQDLIEDHNHHLLEIHTLHDDKRQLLGANCKLEDELQGLKFVLQDRESLIKRLEFKLDRQQIGHGGFVHKGISNVFDGSKVEGARQPEAARLSPLRHGPGNARANIEVYNINNNNISHNKENTYSNSPSPIPVHQQRSSVVPVPYNNNFGGSTDVLGMSAMSSNNPLATFKSPEPPAKAADTTVHEHENLTVSQKAVARVRTGLTDLKGKLAVMKEKKEQAEAQMLKELADYNQKHQN